MEVAQKNWRRPNLRGAAGPPHAYGPSCAHVIFSQLYKFVPNQFV